MARIAVITAGGPAAAIIINRLLEHYPDLIIILEQPEPKAHILKRRARIIGWFQTLLQLPTQMLSKFAKAKAKARYAEIEQTFGVSMSWPNSQNTIKIQSANSQELPRTLSENGIELAFIVGARMLSHEVVDAITCPILNFHAGLTPDYRGVNGGYWALVEGKPDRYGGTIHFVDHGVDTGDVIAQVVCDPHPSDTLLSHQHAITAGCADACVAAVGSVSDGEAVAFKADGNSKQHFHPSIFGYVWTGLTKSVW